MQRRLFNYFSSTLAGYAIIRFDARAIRSNMACSICTPCSPGAELGALHFHGPRAPIGTTPTSPGRTWPYPVGTITARAHGLPWSQAAHLDRIARLAAGPRYVGTTDIVQIAAVHAENAGQRLADMARPAAGADELGDIGDRRLGPLRPLRHGVQQPPQRNRAAGAPALGPSTRTAPAASSSSANSASTIRGR